MKGKLREFLNNLGLHKFYMGPATLLSKRQATSSTFTYPAMWLQTEAEAKKTELLYELVQIHAAHTGTIALTWWTSQTSLPLLCGSSVLADARLIRYMRLTLFSICKARTTDNSVPFNVRQLLIPCVTVIAVL